MKNKYAVIGFPIHHSLSPLMHEAGFKFLGLEGEYHRIPVTIDKLEESLDYLKSNHYAGWNVTFPLKEKIMPLLDYITPEALACGAVNTVKVVQGNLYGYNTDGEGFVQFLQEKGFDFSKKQVVILGAGGSAKAIAVALAKTKVKTLILNRTEEKAEKLARQIRNLGAEASWGSFKRGEWLYHVDLLIQTTSLGMSGEQYPLDLQGLNSRAWVVDLIYKPMVTPFLNQAAAYGCQTFNGLGMLLHQGALAWKIWLGIEAPLSAMREALLRGLREGKKNGDNC
ncbi:MAG: shikimate dehydrogenase [Desulfitobacteriia bacterium]|jgi:shikimate dehydrogenase